jgi:agmatine/peptidylarginine deiminase
MIAFTGVSVWVYFGLVERIAFLEHNLELTMQEVEENDNWIDDFEPPKSVQDTVARVHDLEIEIARIKLLLEAK